MIAVLMLGLLWTASARLTEEQSSPSTDNPVRAQDVLGHDCPSHWGTDIPVRAASLDTTVQATIRIPAAATVNAPRFRLGDIATIEAQDPALQAQLQQIELGASPLAGQTRLFTKQQLMMRLRQHKIDLSAVKIEMPDAVRLTRAAQTLDTTQLEQFAREQLKAVVGDSAGEWTLENPPTPASIPNGAVEFRLEGAPRTAQNSATIEITALVEGQPRAKYLLRFKAPQKTRQIAVRSGEGVQVRVVSGGVVLEVRGVARATGAPEELIPVYIPDTQKTIRALIVESGIVEVRL
ncbi:MAG: flagella basal body P-ring formation protein FlgA [Fimbriimonadales bacterium]